MPDGAPSLALDAFLIITPPAGALSGGIQLVGTPSPDPQDAGGVAVEVAAFEFGIASAATTGGAGAGKVSNSPFTVTKAVDSLSPSLLTLVGTGVRFARMELYLRYPPHAGGVGQASANLAYTFGEVVITEVVWRGTANDEAPSERVTFQYGSLAEAFPPTALPATATPTATQTATPTATPTTTPTATPTATPVPAPTALPTATPTPTPAPTATPTVAPTPTLLPGSVAPLVGSVLYRRGRAPEPQQHEAGAFPVPGRESAPPAEGPDEP